MGKIVGFVIAVLIVVGIVIGGNSVLNYPRSDTIPTASPTIDTTVIDISSPSFSQFLNPSPSPSVTVTP